jgi:3'-phosphoadenosine 5'-phosphosulfate sulfotransferase (PAPS reductase)/FAD synthetase
MKNYLSFGGGVNSVALYLYLADQGIDFEAVFVDHGGDWPETYEYVEMFRKKYPLTILKPKRKIKTPAPAEFDSIVDFCFAKKMFPSRSVRWCTADFKLNVLNKYQETPAFVFIGFDYDERHRAKIYSDKGREFRHPLIEAEIGRDRCKEIIREHGLPVPPKSGCYICPFQRVGQLRLLRKTHPDLFCKLEQLENRNNKERERRGLDPYYSFGKPVREVAEKDINQMKLWKEDEYPPCECGL